MLRKGEALRLIDADALQRRICGAKCGCEYEDCWNEEGCVYDHFISNTPTMDAVPVVRCRECNHCDPENYHCDHPMSTAAPLRRKPDDFCSYGERKEGADNEP